MNSFTDKIKRNELEKLFLETLNCKSRVQGLTHNFYRYPARFSPKIANLAIKIFTEPGELVMDPFMGGGTLAFKI